MLLIVGEPIVAYQRDVTCQPDAEFTGPWASGSPAICAYVSGMLGTPVAFAGAVGDDPHGRVMRGRLNRATVDCEALVVRPDLETAWARVTYQDGARTFDFHVADSAATTLHSNDLGTLPEQARWVHLSGSALVFGGVLVDTALTAVDRARRAGATVSVDPNVRPESLSPEVRARLVEAIREAHVVLPSESELAALGVHEDELVEAGAVVCTTYGKRGAHVRQGTISRDVPGIEVAPVDTDGAGDSFAAGYISAVLRGASPVDAADYGCRTAAAAVQHKGPMTWTFENVPGPVSR